jgi:4-methylaminobutanoate oxidase (formaldehyde-forming)
MGPHSRQVLGRLTDADLGNEAFPFGTARWIDVGFARVLALRISFVGELGWELYIPTESAVHVHDELVRAGADDDLRHAGYFALDTLRSEKGFRHWGADIGPADTPLETGLAFTCAWDKPIPFIGRAALEAQRGGPQRRRLVHVVLDDPEPLLFHHESILRDDRVVGHITSGAYGHTIGAAVGLAVVQDDAGVTAETLAQGHFEVNVAGTRVPARVGLRPPYDPDGARMRV